jgi:L,D-peptidoglycan transpeptidase YkuD (ErfK/YbiS/YcfS/YnhG family)
MNNIVLNSSGLLSFNNKEYQCALGKGGVRADKQEGDGVTPIGCFSIKKVYYRPDKFKKSPKTVFPIQALIEDDGWSDDVNLPEYNTHVKIPYNGSYEKLWRDDNLYDIIIVLGYNDNPPITGKGSAIFMHVAGEGYTPTEGCVGLSKESLLEILEVADKTTQVCIKI